HEALRTVCKVVDGVPWQVVLDAAEGPGLPVLDLSGVEPIRQHEQARHAIEDDLRESFDLLHGPLLRARLVKLAADDHVLGITLHHMVSDGWSTSVFLDELATHYA